MLNLGFKTSFLKMVLCEEDTSTQWCLWVGIVRYLELQLLFVFVLKKFIKFLKLLLFHKNWNMFRYLLEYMWREQVRRSGADLFKSFLQLIAERQSVISPPEEIPKVWEIVCFMEWLFHIICCCFQYFLELNSPLWDCMYCGLPMSSKEEQRVHIQRDCHERPPWEHFCPFCGLEFPSKPSLTTHISRWCTERPSSPQKWLFVYVYIQQQKCQINVFQTL